MPRASSSEDVGDGRRRRERGSALKRLRGVLAFLVLGLVGSQLIAPVAVQATHPPKPTRVIVLVLDQTRRDTITRYGMENVLGLMHDGVSFPNAYLGHMAAETVITHNVVMSGQFPKHMGWTNEVYRDVGNVTGLGEGSLQVTSSMSCAQFRALVDARGYLKLQDYLDSRFGESSTFASIAEKRSAACPAGATDGAIDPEQFAPPDPGQLGRGPRLPIADPQTRGCVRERSCVPGSRPHLQSLLDAADGPVRDRRDPTSVDVSARGEPFPAGLRPGTHRRRRLVRRRRDRRDRERPELARDDGQPRGDRQGRAHVGPEHHPSASPAAAP